MPVNLGRLARMYPFIRMIKEFWVHRNAPALPVYGTHVSHHVCWPWDIDLWVELNNGRTLTLYDLGRTVMAQRVGLLSVAKTRRWGVSVAGAAVRYRKRVRMFDRFEMRSRSLGFDDKFTYVEQSLWRGDVCCSHIVLRTAVTDAAGIVPSMRVAEALGVDPVSRPLPEWVQTWIAAEALRPWPPEM